MGASGFRVSDLRRPSPRGVETRSSELHRNGALQHVAKISQLQADLVSTARTSAVDEVGAAMAHQLHEPLTALLLYLHEIRGSDEDSGGPNSDRNSIKDMAGRALRETERVCDILERLGHGPKPPVDGGDAVARGHEAIEWLALKSTAQLIGPNLSAPTSVQRLLTKREREVLAAITEGASNKQGGHQLGISTRTFEVHRAHIMGKLHARNAADLVRMALSDRSSA
jgi:DNA-binding CsgD family transcriptional regulator